MNTNISNTLTSTPDLPTQSPVLDITEAAVSRLTDLFASQKKPNNMLRIFITGGGCSGFQYGFNLDQVQKEGDQIIEKSGIKVVIDAKSFPYLVGSKLDFQSSLTASQFVVENPNAEATCGCGSSFTLKECNKK